MTIAQVRIYPINPGQMDEWVRFFNEKIAPIHEKYGIHIAGAWVEPEKNEFVWIREFADEADRTAKIETYNDSPERRALGDKPQSYHPTMDVRDVTDVYEKLPLSV